MAQRRNAIVKVIALFFSMFLLVFLMGCTTKFVKEGQPSSTIILYEGYYITKYDSDYPMPGGGFNGRKYVIRAGQQTLHVSKGGLIQRIL